MDDSRRRPIAIHRAGRGLTALAALLGVMVGACGGAATSSPGGTPPGTPLGIVGVAPSASSASAATSGTGAGSGATPAATATVAATPNPAATPSPVPTPAPASLAGPDYRIDTTATWYHFTSTKCGGAAGRWLIDIEGTYDLGGGSLVLTGTGTADLDAATLSGPWEARYKIRLEGVPAAVGGQDGTVSGQATLVGDLLQFRSLVGSGTYFAQTPALALGGPADDPRTDFDLPVQSGPFC